MATTVAAPRPTLRYHPIRGAIYGLLFGLGLALVLMVFKVLALSVPIILVLGVLFLALGAVWGRFAPPRGAKKAPPSPPVAAAPLVARRPCPPSPTPAPGSAGPCSVCSGAGSTAGA